MLTYDLGADSNYISETDRQRAGLPILRPSKKRVGVANGDVSTGNNVTSLPIPHLDAKDTEADTFDDFPHSLMSVGQTSDAGTISIFGKDGVTVHKEEDVLITCKGEPIMIGVRDMHGRYRIPLVQSKNNWQPRVPCSLRLPSQIHMALRNRSGKLCWMATAHGTQREKVLP